MYIGWTLAEPHLLSFYAGRLGWPWLTIPIHDGILHYGTRAIVRSKALFSLSTGGVHRLYFRPQSTVSHQGSRKSPIIGPVRRRQSCTLQLQIKVSFVPNIALELCLKMVTFCVRDPPDMAWDPGTKNSAYPDHSVSSSKGAIVGELFDSRNTRTFLEFTDIPILDWITHPS